MKYKTGKKSRKIKELVLRKKQIDKLLATITKQNDNPNQQKYKWKGDIILDTKDLHRFIEATRNY